MISDISYCRVPTDLSALRTSHATFARGSCQKVFAHRVFSFCPRRSSNQWKKNTRPWVFHDFLSVSLFNFPSVFHFCWAAGPARRTAEKLWGGWDFTFKDGWGKHWTNWCIRVHISLIITRQLCHTLKTNLQEQTGSMTTMQEASCLIVGLSDCHCKRNSCFVFASFVWCWIKFCHVRLIHSVVKALDQEKSKNDEFEVRQNHLTGIVLSYDFRHFILQSSHWFECIAHITCYVCSGQLPKSFCASCFFLLSQKKLQSMKEEYEAMGFPWFSIGFPLQLSISVPLLLGSRPGSKNSRKALRRMGFYLQRCLPHWTNWCIRVHISLIITRQLCHTLKTNFQEQTGSMTTMQEASCLIVGLSDCHCKRNSCSFCFREFCLMLDQVCHVRLIHSVVKALEKEKSKNDQFEVRQKPSNRYCVFIWFQTFHIAEFPLIWVHCAHHMLRLLGAAAKKFLRIVFFSFCPRRSSNQWKKNTRPWVFHDFLSVSLFNFPPVFHFCWAAGPARRTAEKLWGGWDFTFKDGWAKYWTNWCIRVHTTVITRQLCHTLKTNFQEQTGSMTTMQEASCLIVGLSDCHCKRNSCFVFASFVWCWIKFAMFDWFIVWWRR